MTEPKPSVHEATCTDGDCPGCWVGLVGEGKVSEADVAAVEGLRESNRTRMAAIVSTAGIKMPDFTAGLIEKLADWALGADTVRRYGFMLDWESTIAQWIDAQEAEIRKARAASGTNGGTPPGLKLLGPNGS